MRCDTPVYFQSVTDGRYNYTSGNYGDDTVTEIMRYAAVTDARNCRIALRQTSSRCIGCTIAKPL